MTIRVNAIPVEVRDGVYYALCGGCSANVQTPVAGMKTDTEVPCAECGVLVLMSLVDAKRPVKPD